jgi:hypothetical protein
MERNRKVQETPNLFLGKYFNCLSSTPLVREEFLGCVIGMAECTIPATGQMRPTVGLLVKYTHSQREDGLANHTGLLHLGTEKSTTVCRLWVALGSRVNNQRLR